MRWNYHQAPSLSLPRKRERGRKNRECWPHGREPIIRIRHYVVLSPATGGRMPRANKFKDLVQQQIKADRKFA